MTFRSKCKDYFIVAKDDERVIIRMEWANRARLRGLVAYGRTQNRMLGIVKRAIGR